jgi:hypothetical protein
VFFTKCVPSTIPEPWEQKVLLYEKTGRSAVVVRQLYCKCISCYIYNRVRYEWLGGKDVKIVVVVGKGLVKKKGGRV